MGPMTEVGGNAAIYIDPLDYKTSAKITNEVIEWSEDKKKSQIKKGYENVTRFSRRALAKEYEIAYQDALKLKKD